MVHASARLVYLGFSHAFCLVTNGDANCEGQTSVLCARRQSLSFERNQYPIKYQSLCRHKNTRAKLQNGKSIEKQRLVRVRRVFNI